MFHRITRRSLRPVTVLVVAALFWLAPTSTWATVISLEDLNNGASISSSDGRLTFDNFNVTLPGGTGNVLSGIDLGMLTVDVTNSGIGISVFELDAPLVAVSGTSGSLVIVFDVTASIGYSITQVDMSMTGLAIGQGSLAEVAQVFESAGGVTALAVSRSGDGTGSPLASTEFAPGTAGFQVMKTLTVSAGDGGIAQISEAQDSYYTAPVPEPSAALLFGLGSLVVAGRVRRS